MPTRKFIDDDFVVVRREPNSKAKRAVTLVFGDPVEVLEEKNGWTKVRVLNYFARSFTGYVRGKLPVRDKGVLSLSMVDVQQGDGIVLETPTGEIVLIDGGDNQLFARHVAARYLHRKSSEAKPLEVAAIIVTHGDADHFDGLNDIVRSESLPDDKAKKRLFIHPKRIYHNGLVKGPTKDATGKTITDRNRFGRTVKENGKVLAIDLYDDPRKAPPEQLNTPFKRWAKSIDHWNTRGPIDVRRVAHGMNESDLFGFLHDEGIHVELQGPFATETIDPATGKHVAALPFFHKPPRSSELHLEHGGEGVGSISASHTINGHSLAFRLTYGNVRLNLTGDLNHEAMEGLFTNIPSKQLEAEILKVPHHGSHDFGFRALEAIRPVVAIISSGDESALKERSEERL